MGFGLFARAEGVEVAALACLEIFLARAQAMFARLPFADHSGFLIVLGHGIRAACRGLHDGWRVENGTRSNVGQTRSL